MADRPQLRCRGPDGDGAEEMGISWRRDQRQWLWTVGLSTWWRGADGQLITVSAGILWTGCWTLVVVSTRRFRDLLSNGSISRLEPWKLSALYYEHCPPKCSEPTSEGWGGVLTNPLDLQHVNTLTTRSPFRHHLLQRPSSAACSLARKLLDHGALASRSRKSIFVKPIVLQRRRKSSALRNTPRFSWSEHVWQKKTFAGMKMFSASDRQPQHQAEEFRWNYGCWCVWSQNSILFYVNKFKSQLTLLFFLLYKAG